jgi:hypothetical protein
MSFDKLRRTKGRRPPQRHKGSKNYFYEIKVLRQAQEDKGKKGATKTLRHKDDFC